MKLAYVLLLYIVIVSGGDQSCHNDHDCRHGNCDGHNLVYRCLKTNHDSSGQCQCLECLTNHDCPHCHDHQFQYCSGRYYTCGCEECTHDSHCTDCAVGQTGKCHRHHDTERKFCQCEGNALTTTVKSPLKLECSHRKISVIESIAENLHVEDSRAALCPGTTKHQTSDAFVINKCNSTARSSWLKGESVKSLCSSGSITQYTPISTFHQNENMAAFFIDCSASNHELKVAVQTCIDPPYILMLNETTSPKMSDFYIILQQV
ncbi:uncharacterized protein LOC128192111 [Crassostrea angulata]|uniref:uncharacterized protein LOC128192111 n=1 Tax=Magallana angulata TaxID=2784310 RepID=UPI0022B0D270|nr:uncharacterized protein LOC128192111 [Crassostrea angulata]